MAVARETELYPPIKNFFASRGYEVKSEVRGCDLVAIHPAEPEPTIVEMKKTFTLPLLLQGIDRQQTGAKVWLAVERNRAKKGAHSQRFHDLTSLCRRLRLGLMTVTFYKTKSPVIEVWCEPETLFRSARAASGNSDPDPDATAIGQERPTPRMRKAAARLRKEFDGRSGDYNLGGSSRRKLVTAYRERSLLCAMALRVHGPSAPRNIREWTGCANAGAILRDNYYGWFVRVQKGVYQLTPSGEQALREYNEIVAQLAARLTWASAVQP
jgi:hypothetical protein